MDRQRRHTRSLATGDFPWESSPALLELPKHGKAAPDQRQKLVLVDDAEIAYSYSFEGRQPHAWHRPMRDTSRFDDDVPACTATRASCMRSAYGDGPASSNGHLGGDPFSKGDPPADRQTASHPSCGRELAVHLAGDGPLEASHDGLLGPARFWAGNEVVGRLHWRSSGGGLLDPEGVESPLIGVVAPDVVDDAVADTDQLASSDVERAFAAERGRPLDGHDIGVANGDVEQLGAEGTSGQRPQLRQEVVADLSPPAVVASDRTLTGKVPQRVRGETTLGRHEVDICHRLVKAPHNVLSCITHAHHDDRRPCPRVDPPPKREADLSCLRPNGRHQRGSRGAARGNSAGQGLGQRGESGDRIVSGRGEQLDSDVLSAGLQMLGDAGSNRAGITVIDQCVNQAVASAVDQIGSV